MIKTEQPELDHYADDYECKLKRSTPSLAMESDDFAAYKVARIVSNTPNHQSLKILRSGCGLQRFLERLPLGAQYYVEMA